MEALEIFKQAATLATDNELDRLRLLEELLIMAVKKRDTPQRKRQDYLREVAIINTQQLELLGHKRGA